MSNLPFKMTRRRGALMRQIVCFDPRRASLSDVLAAWEYLKSHIFEIRRYFLVPLAMNERDSERPRKKNQDGRIWALSSRRYSTGKRGSSNTKLAPEVSMRTTGTGSWLMIYVTFYGKERSAQANLPVKTDQDTLR
ncbi:uncharacterized protein LOC130136655 isoform X2 [Syzygium oleosum]|uniref:uncharacterized protein LOC130136655 isoform X2 n=1 Tax=Syzygium oleosum TaxID=219896 RepID=UPI0024BA0A5B|nr:uncharacterized protein LOC130136655 isoform X2 [Syzygium oleosum]